MSVRPHTGRHHVVPVQNPYTGFNMSGFPPPSAPPLPEGGFSAPPPPSAAYPAPAQGRYPQPQAQQGGYQSHQQLYPAPGLHSPSQAAWPQQEHYAQPQNPYAGRPPQRARPPIVMDRPWEKYGVSQDEYDYMASLFINFDDDDGGSLDRTEVTRLAKWLNYPASQSDIGDLFRAVDQDRSGTLDLHEFLTFYMNKKPDPQFLYGMTQREYNETLMKFRTYDSNFDGFLSLPEFQKLAMAQGVVHSPQEAANMFHTIDSDHSGSIDLNEFLTYMRPFRG